MSEVISPASSVVAKSAPRVGFVSLGCPKALTDSELILTIHVEWPDGARLAATVSAQKLRRIASLSLPYVDISFGFFGMNAADRDGFLVRFDRAFQKGGG